LAQPERRHLPREVEPPIRKIVDEIHTFTGLWTPGGVCRIRAYDQDPPIIIATELPENQSTPIHLMSPYLYPEVVRTLFPYHFSEAVPIGWIDHELPGKDTPRHGYELVVFDSYQPRVTRDTHPPRVRVGNSNHSTLTKRFVTQVLEHDPEREDEAERIVLQHKRRLAHDL